MERKFVLAGLRLYRTAFLEELARPPWGFRRISSAALQMVDAHSLVKLLERIDLLRLHRSGIVKTPQILFSVNEDFSPPVQVAEGEKGRMLF